jgi:D-psicose/D-tagatose/L-ribulose 3-epimerase
MLTSLPLPFEEGVRAAAALGFTHVDVVALTGRPAGDKEALADSGLLVSCAALGRGLPEGHTLDAASVEVRRATLDALKRQVADAAQLGATHGYIVPGLDGSADGLARFTDTCRLLAAFASQRMVRLGVEHVPGRALSTAAATLAWLEEVADENLGLLLDVGHCLITREEPPAVIARAGGRLGYVHFDDNDGIGDLHLPLLEGRLTEGLLAGVLAALEAADYQAALALELNPDYGRPAEALAQGKALLVRVRSGCRPV